MLQCVAVCCNALHKLRNAFVVVCCSVLQCVAVCCSVLQCITCATQCICCSVLQCVAVCCSVLQCVAVCCSVLQCITQAMQSITLERQGREPKGESPRERGIDGPPKDGIIALPSATNGSIPDFYYCLVVNRKLLKLLSSHILVSY